MTTVDIWTDGACSGNPGQMGIGVVVKHAGQRSEAGMSIGDGTSNIAELRAIELGLSMVGGFARALPVRIYSDSAYAIGVLSKNWKAKANVDLIAQVRALLALFANVTFVKVRGHSGVAENERCDALATGAISGAPPKTSLSIADVELVRARVERLRRDLATAERVLADLEREGPAP